MLRGFAGIARCAAPRTILLTSLGIIPPNHGSHHETGPRAMRPRVPEPVLPPRATWRRPIRATLFNQGGRCSNEVHPDLAYLSVGGVRFQDKGECFARLPPVAVWVVMEDGGT